MERMRIVALAAFVVIVLVVIGAAAGHNHSSSSTTLQSHTSTSPPTSATQNYSASTTIQIQSNSSTRLCFNSAANITAMRMAIYNGITCFRMDMHVNSPSDAAYIQNTSAMGAEWLGILDYATVSGQNWTLSDWNTSVSEAIVQYPQIHEWEIWNEPDNFRSTYQDWNATRYFYMMRSASVIIKSRYPNDTVVCFGGASTHPITGPNNMDTVEYEYIFYQQAWDEGASRYCDAISLHPYDDYMQYNISKLGYNGTGLTMAGEWNYSLNLYENLTHKPIWITETGLESPNSYSDNYEQPLYMRQAVGLLSSHPYVKRIYWFQLASYPTFQWGLINLWPQFRPRPAWYIYINYSKNGTR
ncbi:MAG: hypothetical protein KGH72_05590 [Candidatus Micrarchaeota archaeon]|nr:hypothetical protein [Candidatus Micrarchaeota archaeon]